MYTAEREPQAENNTEVPETTSENGPRGVQPAMTVRPFPRGYPVGRGAAIDLPRGYPMGRAAALHYHRNHTWGRGVALLPSFPNVARIPVVGTPTISEEMPAREPVRRSLGRGIFMEKRNWGWDLVLIWDDSTQNINSWNGAWLNRDSAVFWRGESETLVIQI